MLGGQVQAIGGREQDPGELRSNQKKGDHCGPRTESPPSSCICQLDKYRLTLLWPPNPLSIILQSAEVLVQKACPLYKVRDWGLSSIGPTWPLLPEPAIRLDCPQL